MSQISEPKRDESRDAIFRFECDKCAMPLWYGYENVKRIVEAYKIAHAAVREKHKEKAPDCKGDMYYQGWDWRHLESKYTQPETSYR